MVVGEKLSKLIKTGWSFFVDFLFPIECLGCGQEKLWLCRACQGKLKLKTDQQCLVCRQYGSGAICGRCRNVDSPKQLWYALDYDQALVKRLIKNFKYSFVKDLNQPLGQAMVDFLNTPNMVEAVKRLENVVVVPVPLHPRRERWRGYNQAELLAKQICEKRQWQLEAKLLKRVKYTQPQAKRQEAERHHLRGAFSLDAEVLKNLANRPILLIDDVVTSGATMDECSRVLKAAGVNRVYALALARG